MSTEPPSRSQPKTEKHLGRLVSNYAETSGLGVRRVRQRVSAMAFLGALGRVREEDSPGRFLIKGGIACELRFQNQARATRDLDALFHGSLDELLADLDTAFATPYSGFSFSYTPPEAVRETGAYRFDVKLAYEGRGWATLRVEVSPPEGLAHEPESVPALSVSQFGLTGPTEVACLSLRYQIAQKIHAGTERFPDRENERVHDLVDLQLMEELIEDYGRVKAACIEIFELRGTHAWPPTLTAEPTWAETYRELAAELDFPTKDLDEAVTRVQALIDEIHAERPDEAA
ncbi:MAG: nucleotidyl transferase AbiEii/AbiGii toxin family protein [Terriglobales bacterium]